MALETEHRRLDPATVLAGTRALLGRPAYGRYFVAKIVGEVIGQAMVTYEWSDWRNGVIWWLQSVYVAPEHRRKGVFRALLAHIERAARESDDAVGLRLYVERENQAALATYRQLGFVASGHVVYEMDWSGLASVGNAGRVRSE
jgi:ribosomal protein S18 acetylase RimI-like enzyme